jgi:phospholipid transport system substrate-binding protein
MMNAHTFKRAWLGLLGAVLVCSAHAAENTAGLAPNELVTKVAQDTLKELDAHRAEYKKNPSKVRELVDKTLLPHFDT